jgi:hypothetical protein
VKIRVIWFTPFSNLLEAIPNFHKQMENSSLEPYSEEKGFFTLTEKYTEATTQTIYIYIYT